MSVSTYKRWMKESYLYEADDDKVIGKNDKGDPVTVRQALDSSSDNPTMVKLKKKAQDLKTKDKGGEEKPKAKPKTTAISKTGGLGGDDEEKPSGEEPSGEPEGDLSLPDEETLGDAADELATNDAWDAVDDGSLTEEDAEDLDDIGTLIARQAAGHSRADEEKPELKEKLENMSPEARTYFEETTGLKVDDLTGKSEGGGEPEGGRFAGKLSREDEETLGDAADELATNDAWDAVDDGSLTEEDAEDLDDIGTLIARQAAGHSRADEEKPELKEKLENMSPEARTYFEETTGLKVDDFVGEEQGRTGTEEIKVINGKKYKPIKESVDKRISVKEVHKWLKGLEEYRYRKIPGVDARRITSFVNNGLSETDLPTSLQKKWGSAKYSREKHLADKFVKERISRKLAQNESNHPLKEQYNKLFKNKVVL